MDVVAAGPEHDDAVAELFAQYAKAHAYELGDQDVVAEGLAARRKYAAPGGLLVAVEANRVVGCVAFEPWGTGRARMKRMFVPPSARGKGVGRRLAVAVIDAASQAGFTHMVLDTSKPMVAATALYRSLGFVEFEPDYDAPCKEVVYLQRDL